MRWLRSYGIPFSLCEDGDDGDAMAPDPAVAVSSDGAA
jgi:hypothetical protein